MKIALRLAIVLTILVLFMLFGPIVPIVAVNVAVIAFGAS